MLRFAVPCALCLGLFLPLAVVAHSGFVSEQEIALAQGIQQALLPTFLPLFLALNPLGKLWAVTLYGMATVAILWKTNHPRESLILFLGLISVQSNFLLKAIIGRPRPDESLLPSYASVSTAHGFPSGDVQLFTVFWGLLFYFAPVVFAQKWAVKGFRVWALLMIVTVGPERVALGVHWPTDVLGGYLIGGATLCALLWLYAYVPLRQQP